MEKLVERIHDIGAVAWLKFLRLANALMAVMLPALLLVHQSYPSVISGLVQQMPPWLGIIAIVGFCLLIHYAIRRSIKAV